MALMDPMNPDFRRIILFLIPDAANWDAAHWCSNIRILETIRDTHGKNYFIDLDDFFALCDLLLTKWSRNTYYRELFAVKDIPPSIAALIWPKNMEKEICKQFSLISRVRPWLVDGNPVSFDVSHPEVIRKSWAYRQIWNWQQTRSCRLSDAVRRNLVHFATGEHPFTVNARNRASRG